MTYIIRQVSNYCMHCFHLCFFCHSTSTFQINPPFSGLRQLEVFLPWASTIYLHRIKLIRLMNFHGPQSFCLLLPPLLLLLSLLLPLLLCERFRILASILPPIGNEFFLKCHACFVEPARSILGDHICKYGAPQSVMVWNWNIVLGPYSLFFLDCFFYLQWLRAPGQLYSQLFSTRKGLPITCPPLLQHEHDVQPKVYISKFFPKNNKANSTSCLPNSLRTSFHKTSHSQAPSGPHPYEPICHTCSDTEESSRMATSLSCSRMTALPLRLANDFSDRRCTIGNHIVANRPRAE